MLFERLTGILVGMLVCASMVAPSRASAFELGGLQPHVTFTLGSHHLNADEHFNERNPGIGIGFTLPARNSEWIYGLEIGQYRNSHYETSQYILGSIERPVAKLGPQTTLKLGLMAGVARYSEHARSLGEKGIPTIGDWILAGGATAAINHRDRVEFRVGVLPAPGVADALFTFQLRIPLGGRR